MNVIDRAHAPTASFRCWLYPAAFRARGRQLIPPLVLFLTTFLALFQYAPLTRPLLEDPGIFAYIAGLVAQGAAPHRAVFNEQASLSFLLGGAAIALGDWFGVPALIALRWLAMLVAAGVVSWTYGVGRVFTRSRMAGLIAGLIMLGYQGYLLRAATALEPKSLMVLFGLTALYFLYRRKWFWAGLSAGAAGLAWQLGWGYLVIALLLAFVQGGKLVCARAAALTRAAAGAALILAAYAAYFFAQGALVEMLQQTFIAPILMHPVAQRDLAQRWLEPLRAFQKGYPGHIVPALLGALGWCARLLYLLPAPRRALYFFFQNRRTSGTLLAFHGFLLITLFDFQNYPDWIPLLPFLSIFAAGLLRLAQRARVGTRRAQWRAWSPTIKTAAWALLLLVLGVTSVFHPFTPTTRVLQPPALTWQKQARLAQDLNRVLAPDDSVFIIGSAEMLFFMGRQNLTPYIYFIGQTDAAVEVFEVGGFEGWLERVRAAQPALILLTRLKASKFAQPLRLKQLRRLPVPGYVRLKRCGWLHHVGIYLRADLASRALPRSDRSACFTLAMN